MRAGPGVHGMAQGRMQCGKRAGPPASQPCLTVPEGMATRRQSYLRFRAELSSFLYSYLFFTVCPSKGKDVPGIVQGFRFYIRLQILHKASDFTHAQTPPAPFFKKLAGPDCG